MFDFLKKEETTREIEKRDSEFVFNKDGFKDDDIKIFIEDGYLKAKAKRKVEEKSKYGTYTEERSFTKQYYVGDDVTMENVKIEFTKDDVHLKVKRAK